MDPEAKKDLIWVILFLAGLFALWLATGGPERASENGLLLKSPHERGSEEILRPLSEETDGSQKQGVLMRESFYKTKVSLSAGAGAKANTPQTEYIELTASYSNGAAIDISNWTLENKKGEKIKIGLASSLPKFGEINAQENILLAPKEKAFIITGQSPIGTGFKVNKCSGYLQEMRDFIPKINLQCPHPINDERLPATLDNGCIDFLKKEYKKCSMYLARPTAISNECQGYIDERLNYNGCVSWHRRDSDFYGPEWRIYLNKNSELWANDHDTIILYDENNKIIDWRTY